MTVWLNVWSTFEKKKKKTKQVSSSSLLSHHCPYHLCKFSITTNNNPYVLGLSFWVCWIVEVGAIGVHGCLKIIDDGATNVDGCVEINFGFHYGKSLISSVLTFINHHCCWTMEEKVMWREENEREGDLFSFFVL